MNKWLFILVLLIGFVAAWLLYNNREGWTKESVLNSIKSELSVGDPMPKVEAWIVRRGLKLTRLQSPFLEYRGPNSIVEVAGLPHDSVSTIFKTQISEAHVKQVLFHTYKLNIFFFFDNEDRLIKWYVEKFTYSF